jgi:hypothetical protein
MIAPADPNEFRRLQRLTRNRNLDRASSRGAYRFRRTTLPKPAMEMPLNRISRFITPYTDTEKLEEKSQPDSEEESEDFQHDPTSGFVLEYTYKEDENDEKEEGEKIKLYIGEFEELGGPLDEGYENTRYCGLILTVNGEVVEKFRGRKALEALLDSGIPKLKSFERDKIDPDELLQNLYDMIGEYDEMHAEEHEEYLNHGDDLETDYDLTDEIGTAEDNLAYLHSTGKKELVF